MEKIFKKSLAIMVSAAICLTALIGCLTVSAERGEGTITVGTVEGKAGDSVTVPVELEYTSSQENGLGIAAALFDVKFDTNVLTITKIEREDPTNDAIAYTVQWRTTDGDESSIDVRDGAVRILAVGKDETAVVPSMSLNLTFTINSEAPAGASNITIENLQACDYGTADIDGIYANDEDMISMSANNGSVTVAEDQTEPVLDENISAVLGAGLDATVYMSFRISKASIAQYSDFYLAIDRKTKDSDWNFTDAETFYINKSDLNGEGSYLLETPTDYWFYYRGTELFSLSIPISAVLYCKDDTGAVVAYSNTFTSSLTTLLKTLYTNAKTNNRQELATALTDTLIAADEAQKFFTQSYPDSDYAKLESPIADFSTEDATAELGPLNTINEDYTGTEGPSFHLGAGVAESPFISVYLTDVPSGDSINDYSVEFSYYNQITKRTEVSTTSGADMLVSAGSPTRYYSYLRTLAIYASNADVTIKLYKNETELGVAHYSFEQFVSDNIDNERMGSVLISLGKLGQSFRVLKGI